MLDGAVALGDPAHDGAVAGHVGLEAGAVGVVLLILGELRVIGGLQLLVADLGHGVAQALLHLGHLCADQLAGVDGIVGQALLLEQHAGVGLLLLVGLALGSVQRALIHGIVVFLRQGLDLGQLLCGQLHGLVEVPGDDRVAHVLVDAVLHQGVHLVGGHGVAEVVLIHVVGLAVVVGEFAHHIVRGDLAAVIGGDDLAELLVQLGDVLVRLHIGVHFNQIAAGKHQGQRKNQAQNFGKSCIHTFLPHIPKSPKVSNSILYTFP